MNESHDDLWTAEDWSDLLGDLRVTEDALGRAPAVLLTRILGSRLVLLVDDVDQTGNWSAAITDGVRVGLIAGWTDSCTCCDVFLSCTTTDDLRQLLAEHLSSVQTFQTWRDVEQHLETFSGRREPLVLGHGELLRLARMDVPLDVLDVLDCLRRDNPEGDAFLMIEAAVALR